MVVTKWKTSYIVTYVSCRTVACSDGGAGGARHTLAPKKRGGGERRRPTPTHVRTHTWCKVQMLESAQRTHSAWTRVRTRVRTYVWPAVQCALQCRVGARLPLLGPGHTDKRIRFCDTILGKVLRYSFAESLSRGHTAIVHRRSITERTRIHCSF